MDINAFLQSEAMHIVYLAIIAFLVWRFSRLVKGKNFTIKATDPITDSVAERYKQVADAMRDHVKSMHKHVESVSKLCDRQYEMHKEQNEKFLDGYARQADDLEFAKKMIEALGPKVEALGKRLGDAEGKLHFHDNKLAVMKRADEDIASFVVAILWKLGYKVEECSTINSPLERDEWDEDGVASRSPRRIIAREYVYHEAAELDAVCFMEENGDPIANLKQADSQILRSLLPIVQSVHALIHNAGILSMVHPRSLDDNELYVVQTELDTQLEKLKQHVKQMTSSADTQKLPSITQAPKEMATCPECGEHHRSESDYCQAAKNVIKAMEETCGVCGGDSKACDCGELF